MRIPPFQSALGLPIPQGYQFLPWVEGIQKPHPQDLSFPEHLYHRRPPPSVPRALQALQSPNFCGPITKLLRSSFAHLGECLIVLPDLPLKSSLTPPPSSPS